MTNCSRGATGHSLPTGGTRECLAGTHKHMGRRVLLSGLGFWQSAWLSGCPESPTLPSGADALGRASPHCPFLTPRRHSWHSLLPLTRSCLGLFVLFVHLRQRLTMQPWLAWNYVNQASLELRDLLASDSRVLGWRGLTLAKVSLELSAILLLQVLGIQVWTCTRDQLDPVFLWKKKK